MAPKISPPFIKGRSGGIYGECRDNYGTINKDDAEVVNDGVAEPGKEIIEEPRLRLPQSVKE
jgi:hypothetical protein